MSISNRIHFAEILRAREQCLLMLAATKAVIDRYNERWLFGLIRIAGAHRVTRHVKFHAALESELLLIEQALGQLRADPQHFGLCRDCGRPIALERLNMAPWTTSCEEHNIVV